MKAIVLCAGGGSRLYPFSDLIPKSMMPVGGKPVLRWIIERLRLYAFKKIVLCVNKKDCAVFQDYFGDGSRFNVEIEYSVSDNPLGTVGEVLNAKNLLIDEGDLTADFLLYYGDTLTQIELDRLYTTHERARQRDGLVTLALVKNIPLDFGIVEGKAFRWTKGLKITRFLEKPPLEKNVWAGVAIIDPQVFSLAKAKTGEDFGADLFPRLLINNLKIYGMQSNADWMDVGTISHYRRACKLAEEGRL